MRKEINPVRNFREISGSSRPLEKNSLTGRGIISKGIKKITLKTLSHPFWAMSIEEALDALASYPQGIRDEEAKERRRIFGPNLIEDGASYSRLGIVWNQIQSPLIFILIIAGAVTLLLKEWIEAGVILAAVIANTALGFWQENKAERVLEILKTYVRTRVRVRRDGGEREIDASELVPGDVVHLTQGDRVPADCRVIFANALETDESVLTGESLPEAKASPALPVATVLADRSSMLYSGTVTAQGLGEAMVTATGGFTEFGKIAALSAEKERPPTPLQQSITGFARLMGIFVVVAVLGMFAVGIFSGREFLEMFLIAVAIAVSAVPEGLPIALTVILSVGVERLASIKGVVRRLLAAETLGSASIILTDKTGTLTQAKMELTAVTPYGNGNSPEALLKKALAITDVALENPDAPQEAWRISGRPLEVALVKGGAGKGIMLPDVLEQTRALDRLPFGSSYKYSAAIIENDNGSETVLFGAPEIILEFTETAGEEKARILAEIETRARSGERVLGIAAKNGKEKLLARHFSGFSFLGIFAFRDPLRPGVDAAIRKMASAGVKTVIVTGDHQGTAEAVARELGMVDGKGAVLTGDDMSHLSEEALYERAGEVAVFARVTPEQKTKLVELYQRRGEVVAVTGDGVNDAPALKRADIGVAVGSGTDVAKDAADLVLLDDNFEIIVAAIEEGRKIIGNIRKVIVYLLSDAFDELFLIGGALIVGVALPLNALQILFVNFFSDSFPAIAFAFEEGVDDFGKRPRRLSGNIFDRPMKMLIFVIGASTSALLFFLYLFMLKYGFDPDLTRTFIFASFASYTLILAFSLRSLEKSIFSYNPFSNRYLTGGVALGIFLTLGAVYLPFLQSVLGTQPLPFFWLLGVAGVGMANIAAVETAKLILRKRNA